MGIVLVKRLLNLYERHRFPISSLNAYTCLSALLWVFLTSVLSLLVEFPCFPNRAKLSKLYHSIHLCSLKETRPLLKACSLIYKIRRENKTTFPRLLWTWNEIIHVKRICNLQFNILYMLKNHTSLYFITFSFFLMIPLVSFPTTEITMSKSRSIFMTQDRYG